MDETYSALWGVEVLVLPLLLFWSPLPWAPPGLPANSVNAQLGLIRTTRVASQVAAARLSKVPVSLLLVWFYHIQHEHFCQLKLKASNQVASFFCSSNYIYIKQKKMQIYSKSQ